MRHPFLRLMPPDQATHDTLRRVLGPDHPDTLRSAHNLAADLRNLERERSVKDA